MRRVLLPGCAALLLLLVALSAAQDVPISRHVSDKELYTRAGYFTAAGVYMGGVPEHLAKRGFDDNDCQERTTGNRSYCSFWRITQTGSSDEDSEGSCKCLKGSLLHNKYCEAWFCSQVVTQSFSCGDDSYSCSRSFNKYKKCRCTQAAADGTFCTKWQCLGYNDGPVKTANWFCKDLASAVVSGHATANDYCYSFGSDQYSSEVQEAKDCVCTSDAGQYCDRWICDKRIFKNWPWWTPIVGSLVGAVLNFWTPFVARANEDDGDNCCLIAGLLVWTVISYLEIVLVGGVPSLVANTGALVLLWGFVYFDRISCCVCHCSMKERDSEPQRRSPLPCAEPVVGTVVDDSAV